MVWNPGFRLPDDLSVGHVEGQIQMVLSWEMVDRIFAVMEYLMVLLENN